MNWRAKLPEELAHRQSDASQAFPRYQSRGERSQPLPGPIGIKARQDKPDKSARNNDMEFHAGMTKANPMAGALGKYRDNHGGRARSADTSAIPKLPATIIAATAPSGIASNPDASTSATAFHVATAGAGHSDVSNIAVGSGINDEINETADDASGEHAEYLRHDLKPWRRADDLPGSQVVQQIRTLPGRAPETLAVIRLAVMLPGVTTPKVSCVIFPMAPTGVMPVSPATRAATDRKRETQEHGKHRFGNTNSNRVTCAHACQHHRGPQKPPMKALRGIVRGSFDTVLDFRCLRYRAKAKPKAVNAEQPSATPLAREAIRPMVRTRKHRGPPRRPLPNPALTRSGQGHPTR